MVYVRLILIELQKSEYTKEMFKNVQFFSDIEAIFLTNL